MWNWKEGLAGQVQQEDRYNDRKGVRSEVIHTEDKTSKKKLSFVSSTYRHGLSFHNHIDLPVPREK